VSVAAATTRVEVEQVRARHRIEDVIAASGVELRPVGRSLMGCCPFHEDGTASLSVGGVPDRFHCFGCGASGDVIDYVVRLNGMSFLEAVAHLDHVTASPVATRATTLARAQPAACVDPHRAFEVNRLAWEHWTRPVSHEFALAYLRHFRRIDARDAEATIGRALVGHTGTTWSSMINHLVRQGVTIDELVAVDLASRTRRGGYVDTLRGRLVVPVRDSQDRITGFLGRDTTGDARAPKYRNPTRTAVFDKATMLYSPDRMAPSGATCVVVEGPLDALALTAAGATSGTPLLVCSAGGVSVSPAQAAAVAALAPTRPVVLALDGDAAGREGARHWVDLLQRQLGHPVAVVDLPDGRDPADWVADRGVDALGELLTEGHHPAYQNPVGRAADAAGHDPLTHQL
jgi:DNA primase